MAGHRADMRRAYLTRARPGSSRDLGTAVPLDELCRLTKHRRCPSRPVDLMRPPGAMRPLHQFPGPIGPTALGTGIALTGGTGDVHGHGVPGLRRFIAVRRCSAFTSSTALMCRRSCLQGHPRRACRRRGHKIRLAGPLGLRRRLPSWGLAAPCPRRPRSASARDRAQISQLHGKTGRYLICTSPGRRFEHAGGQRC